MDSGFWTPRFEELHNERKRVRYNDFARWLYRRGLFEPARRLLPRRALGPSIKCPVLEGNLRAGVVADLAGEAGRFRKLTGLRFESWSV